MCPKNIATSSIEINEGCLNIFWDILLVSGKGQWVGVHFLRKTVSYLFMHHALPYRKRKWNCVGTGNEIHSKYCEIYQTNGRENLRPCSVFEFLLTTHHHCQSQGSWEWERCDHYIWLTDTCTQMHMSPTPRPRVKGCNTLSWTPQIFSRGNPKIKEPDLTVKTWGNGLSLRWPHPLRVWRHPFDPKRADNGSLGYAALR